MKILCLGHATYDTTFPISSFPIENSKNHFNEKYESVGGPAAVAALLLAKWNMNVSFIGRVGSDAYGDKIKKEMTLNRVNTSFLQVLDNFRTSHSFNLANNDNGSRTLFIYNSNDCVMDDVDLDFNPDIILVDDYECKAAKKILKKYPDAISIMDASKYKKETVDLSRLVNYVVCSKEFAEKLSGIKADFDDKSTLVNIYKKIEKIFTGNLIITLEKEGCIYRIDNKIKLMPAIKVKTVDSTGAGDIFHGAFTYGIANEYDLEKTIKYATLASALSVTKMGAATSIPDLDYMNKVYDEIR